MRLCLLLALLLVMAGCAAHAPIPARTASPNEMRTQHATSVSINIPKVGLSVGSELNAIERASE
jgi:type IV pilus biogenesis protein CpaD/CtpE